MQIALIGYGKMGKEIHGILEQRGHAIAAIVDHNNTSELAKLSPASVDVAIEFSTPETAFENIMTCLDQKVKVVSGTTGWLARMPEVEKAVEEKNGAFFYASNYSLGVNLFFHFNQVLAEIMKDYPGYNVEIEEIHHTQKLDQPSGTAISLAEGVINAIPSKTKWANEESEHSETLSIISQRLPNVPGTHTVSYSSEEDVIELKHTAASRKGFALGAVKVAEWLADKRGFLNMKDYLQIAIANAAK